MVIVICFCKEKYEVYKHTFASLALLAGSRFLISLCNQNSVKSELFLRVFSVAVTLLTLACVSVPVNPVCGVFL
jgi:hypothetical protein